ncbi:EAL domain-containing protein [Vibrio sp. SCSIO 43140]|uniref:EAL domain-containing protein n=1 Tax=Vibrio sp. SCSIO 43140 TaxID=2819100 RepID=UPI002074FCD5|nr:EAL domain-containing protein [Vibrio sp. SCSIO 43140]USD58911.1 EAL domain-containing protein [Vibrio sp. SCSIO 43140]
MALCYRSKYKQEIVTLIGSIVTPLACATGLLLVLYYKNIVRLNHIDTGLVAAIVGVIVGIILCNKLIIAQARQVFETKSMLNYGNRLRTAIENQDIKPYFQSRVSETTNKISGCEALARWEDGDNLVSPAEFIPTAKLTGQIKDIDCEIAIRSIYHLERWLSRGLITEPFTLSFNISAETLNDQKCVNRIKDAVSSVACPIVTIEIEITEESVLHLNDTVNDHIQALRAAGANFAIDDFTAGHCSMHMLNKIDFDTIKLDKSLLTNEVAAPKRRDISFNMIKSFVELSKRLGMETTLEGIESVEALDFYRPSGIENIQGFLFSKPSCAYEFEKHYRQFNYEK